MLVFFYLNNLCRFYYFGIKFALATLLINENRSSLTIPLDRILNQPRNLTETTVYFYWTVMSPCVTLFIDTPISTYEFESAQHALVSAH